MFRAFLAMTFYFFAHLSLAQSSLGSISASLGGAGRSSVDIGDSYVLNPASVAHLRRPTIAFGTTVFKPESHSLDNFDKLVSYEGWHMSLSENDQDAPFGSSIYLSQIRNNNPDSNFYSAHQFNDAWFNFGNFIMPRVSMGLSYHLRETQTLLKNYQEHNLSLGFLWIPLEKMGIGVSFHNLNSPSSAIPKEHTLGSTTGIGFLYLPQDYLRLRLDYSKKFHQLTSQSMSELAFGLENSMNSWLLTRIGIAHQRTDENVSIRKITFGLGFSGPRFGIHYGFQLYQLAQRGTEHSVDFMIPF